jgi:hypothetical protein
VGFFDSVLAFTLTYLASLLVGLGLLLGETRLWLEALRLSGHTLRRVFLAP